MHGCESQGVSTVEQSLTFFACSLKIVILILNVKYISKLNI